MRIITTICHDFTEKDGVLRLLSQEILRTEIISESKEVTPGNVWQFSETDLKYGIASIGKKHPLSPLYHPGCSVRVQINGCQALGKWHNTQCRISGLTALFRDAGVDTQKQYAFMYQYETDCIVFKEIMEG